VLFADTKLRSEMLRELRFQATAPSVVALKDRPQLAKARAIDQEKVIAFQEAREAWDTKKLKNAARQQKPRSTSLPPQPHWLPIPEVVERKFIYQRK